MWEDLLKALGLLLVAEGILPFLNPRGLRHALLRMTRIEDRVLRLAGFGSMVIGVILLYFMR